MTKQTYVVDIGNSRIKSGFFLNGELKQVGYHKSIEELKPGVQAASHTIVGSVRNMGDELRSQFDNSVLYLTHETPLPIRLDYKTPETLGIDRISAAVGAYHLFPSNPSLIIDLGTCNTYDIIDSAHLFQGGSITPGLITRFKSMKDHTSQLPNVSENWSDFSTEIPGKTTKDALVNGVFRGILYEIEGYISYYRKEFANLNVILTGGNASFFESYIKAPIFASPEIVLIGLNRILVHNVEK